MINYLKSEGYRIAHMKSTYLMPLGINLFLLFALSTTWFAGLDDPGFPYNNANFIFSFSRSAIALLSFLIPVVVNIIFDHEHTNGTFKNSVSYGIDRKTLYAGKLILMIVYSFMVTLITFIIFTFSTHLLMTSGTPSDTESQWAFFTAFFQAIVPLLALLIFSHMLSFIIQKTSTHWIIYTSSVVLSSVIFNFLNNRLGWNGLAFLRNVLPYELMNSGSYGWQAALTAFLFYSTISGLIGFRIFSESDV